MEVHAHSHTAPASDGTGRKKWTHYFWEFLMLFLAVTLGFFVENQREHYIERLRAKQFAKSLIKDLNRDTALLITCKTHSNVIADAMDSLREILKRKDIVKVKGNHLYYYGRQLTNNHPFIPSDATIKQLLSSGSLRYFQNPSIVEKITKYESFTRWVVYDQGDNVKAQYIAELQARFFDIDQIELIKIKPDWSFKNDSSLNIQSGLLTYDPVQLQQLKQFARLKMQDMKRFTQRVDSTLVQARQLIAELKKEYKLN